MSRRPADCANRCCPDIRRIVFSFGDVELLGTIPCRTLVVKVILLVKYFFFCRKGPGATANSDSRIEILQGHL